MLACYDKEYLENDTYIIFECLMKDLGYLFEYKDKARNMQDQNQSHIQMKFDEILLKLSHFDSTYHALLLKHGIQPMLGIKWLKMLFSRDFLMGDVLMVCFISITLFHRTYELICELLDMGCIVCIWKEIDIM